MEDEPILGLDPLGLHLSALDFRMIETAGYCQAFSVNEAQPLCTCLNLKSKRPGTLADIRQSTSKGKEMDHVLSTAQPHKDQCQVQLWHTWSKYVYLGRSLRKPHWEPFDLLYNGRVKERGRKLEIHFCWLRKKGECFRSCLS